ncbi:MAG: hypothetical protein WAR79_15160 [Melioribacteraceae bacterium]
MVIHKTKYPTEIDTIKKKGIKVRYLSDIIHSTLEENDTIIKGASGSSLLELINFTESK